MRCSRVLVWIFRSYHPVRDNHRIICVATTSSSEQRSLVLVAFVSITELCTTHTITVLDQNPRATHELWNVYSIRISMPASDVQMMFELWTIRWLSASHLFQMYLKYRYYWRSKRLLFSLDHISDPIFQSLWFLSGFLDRVLLITMKLMMKGILLNMLKSLLRKFYVRHRYGIFVSQMTTDMFHLS
jgi:hypothetical protein